jgi:hypothetical protein
MNPSASGLSSAGKTGVVVVVVIIVLGGAYFAPSLLTGTKSTSSLSAPTCSGTAAGSQVVSLPLLFACFSQMQVQEGTIQNGANAEQTLAYLVLGPAVYNSTQYNKVEFSKIGIGDNVIAWYDSTGSIYRLDIIGGRNYTGPGARYFAQLYTTGFGLISQMSNNASLLSSLSKTSENTTSIGPTQLDVTTYHLAVPTHPVKSLTVKLAAIPGTNLKFVVYMDELYTDGSETTILVSSVTR